MPKGLSISAPTSALTMKYALGAVLAVIHDQSVAACKALLLCYGPGRKYQVTQQTLVGVFSCTDALMQTPHRNPDTERVQERLCYRVKTVNSVHQFLQ